MTRTRIMSPVALGGSVEREGVPRDAVPGHAVPRDAVPGHAVPRDAVPRDAVPRDAVPVEVVPGDTVPGHAVPGKRLPSDATERRVLPAQRQSVEDWEERAGERVRGPERAVGGDETACRRERGKRVRSPGRLDTRSACCSR